MATNKPRIDGPGMVESRDGRLSKRLVDVILDLYERVYSAQTTATEASESAEEITSAPAISISGVNGVTASGDGSTFVVDGQADQHILASQIFGR